MVRYVELPEHSGMTSVLVNPDTVQYLRHVANIARNSCSPPVAPRQSLAILRTSPIACGGWEAKIATA